jgi:hypothetical protein
MGSAAQAVIDIDLQGQEAKAELKALTASIGQFADAAKSSLYAVGGFLAVDKLKDGAAAMLSVFSDAEAANGRLQATLKATGNTTGFTSDQLGAMADAAANAAAVSDEAMAEVQNTFARTKVMSGAVFSGATQTAIDFAAAMKMDVAGAAEELAEAMVDPANELEKFRRFGITFTQAEKDMLAQMTATGQGAEAQMYVLSRLNEVVGGQGAAAAETWAGKQEMLTNKLNDLYAVGGELIAGVLEPMFPVLMNLVDTFIAWTPVLEAVGEGLVSGSESILGWLDPLDTTAATVQAWAATVESVFTRWDDYIAVALLSAGANVVAFATDVGHFFTEVIPGYAESLWIVMKDIFFQLDELIITVVANIGKNIADFWAALESVMSGGDFNFKPTAVLEGFELKLSELPEIADKKMSETEALMRQAAEELSMDLAKDVEVKTKVRVEKVETEKKAKEAKTGEEDKVQKGLVLNKDAAGSGSGGSSTEGLLDLSKRISDAAASNKMAQSIASVAQQQATTNALLTEANSKPDAPINVNVKQDEVVTAINRSADAIVEATKKIAPSKSDGSFG